MDTQGWDVSWERKQSSPIHLGMSSQRGTKWIPVIQVFQWSQRHTCTLGLPSNMSGMQIFQLITFFYFLTFSFCWTNFCWIRASYKQKEVWFQGHSMSETDGSELNVSIYLFENCLNVLFSLHRAYYSTPMVSSWEMFRFVCFSPNMKIIEYQWLIHKKIKIREAPHLPEMQLQLENKAFFQCSLIFQRYYSFVI